MNRFDTGKIVGAIDSTVLGFAKGIVEQLNPFSQTNKKAASALDRMVRGETVSPEDRKLASQSLETLASGVVGGGLKKVQPVISPLIQKIITNLKEATPLRAKQEAIYTVERGVKLAKGKVAEELAGGGEAGFKAKIGALAGEMPKVEFTPIKIVQTDKDALYNMVKNSTLSEWDKLPASTGLSKLLGEFGTTLPTENELALMKKVFPEEMIQAVLDKRSLLQKVGATAAELANVPRSIMSSFDMSAPFRQGLFTVGRKEFWTSLDDMVKSFGSEKSFQSIQNEISQRPSFKLMKESGLSLTDLGLSLSQREERFMSSLAERIPVVGKVVRASGRAYIGFLNKVRADLFDSMTKNAARLGKTDMDFTKQVSNYINMATGRGKLKVGPMNIENAATTLNALIFSPRLAVSRLDILTKAFQPSFYTKIDPFIRRQYLRDLLSITAFTTTTMGIAKAAGAEVGTNPNSSDFLKIKVGKTRFDTLGGFQQYIRMASQLISGKYVSSTTGKTTTLGEGYKPLTRLDILSRQIESKEAPVFSFITDMLRGQDYTGQPVNVVSALQKRFVPMMAGDLADIAKTDPDLLSLGMLGLFGFGVQTYTPTTPAKSSGGNRFNR